MVSSVQGIWKIRHINGLWAQRYRMALGATASSQSKKDIHNTFMNELSEQNDEAKREVYNSPDFPIRT